MIVVKGSVAELVEKKSRFIAYVEPIETEADASAFIASIKKKHYDARHNCTAVILPDGSQRSSDDGEPSGTAGRPMLDVLNGRGIVGVVVVVTRYFGGVLLGTGGLVRAYQGALQLALEECELYEPIVGADYAFTCSYNDWGKVQYTLREMGVEESSGTIDYAQDVVAHLFVPDEVKDALFKKLIDSTAGRIKIEEE